MLMTLQIVDRFIFDDLPATFSSIYGGSWNFTTGGRGTDSDNGSYVLTWERTDTKSAVRSVIRYRATPESSRFSLETGNVRRDITRKVEAALRSDCAGNHCNISTEVSESVRRLRAKT